MVLYHRKRTSLESMSISSHAAATSAYLKRSSHDLFVAMTTIVLEMISSFKMSNATIVYNEFKDFSKHIDDGATFKEDAWLRSAFIFGEIMSKVIILSMKSMSKSHAQMASTLIWKHRTELAAQLITNT
jgi:hypothetical protein